MVRYVAPAKNHPLLGAQRKPPAGHPIGRIGPAPHMAGGMVQILSANCGQNKAATCAQRIGAMRHTHGLPGEDLCEEEEFAEF